MSDDNVSFLLELIDRIFLSEQGENESGISKERKIGVAEHIDLYDPDYDFDEDNDQIAALFGVAE